MTALQARRSQWSILHKENSLIPWFGWWDQRAPHYSVLNKLNHPEHPNFPPPRTRYDPLSSDSSWWLKHGYNCQVSLSLTHRPLLGCLLVLLLNSYQPGYNNQHHSVTKFLSNHFSPINLLIDVFGKLHHLSSRFLQVEFAKVFFPWHISQKLTQMWCFGELLDLRIWELPSSISNISNQLGTHCYFQMLVVWLQHKHDIYKHTLTPHSKVATACRNHQYSKPVSHPFAKGLIHSSRLSAKVFSTRPPPHSSAQWPFAASRPQCWGSS